MPTPRKSRAIPPVVVMLSTRANDPRESLELLRRVRAFAQEMADVGLDVRIDGSLTVEVRAPRRATADPDPDADA
jgi:hypothetical protein